MRHGRYVVESSKGGFALKRRPHPCELEGAPDWIVDLAYEYSGGRRPPVEVTYQPHHLGVTSESWGWPKKLGLVSFYRLTGEIASRLMANWTPVEKDCDHEHCDCHPNSYWRHVGVWVVGRTERAIRGMVHEAWKRTLATIDPEVLEVQKKVFSVSFGYEEARLVMEPEFYKHPFIVRDVKSYPAAAIAAFLCGRLRSTEKGIEVMSDWKSLFSPTGESYRSLNRTLTNLPGGITPALMLKLRRFILPRAITNRLELTGTILAHSADRHRHIRAWSFATEGQIKEAMRRISADCQQELSPRRWADVESVVSYLGDFPDDHNGNLIGLTEKAIRWHRDVRRGAIEADLGRFDQDTKLAKPAIPLPGIPGIRFLETVGELCEEGRDMEHCAASYASRAVDGACFLFHVEHEGEKATAEVNWFGQVVQSRGPRNRDNVAAEWGKRELAKWGKGLTKAAISPSL